MPVVSAGAPLCATFVTFARPDLFSYAGRNAHSLDYRRYRIQVKVHIRSALVTASRRHCWCPLDEPPPPVRTKFTTCRCNKECVNEMLVPPCCRTLTRASGGSRIPTELRRKLLHPLSRGHHTASAVASLTLRAAAAISGARRPAPQRSLLPQTPAPCSCHSMSHRLQQQHCTTSSSAPSRSRHLCSQLTIFPPRCEPCVLAVVLTRSVVYRCRFRTAPTGRVTACAPWKPCRSDIRAAAICCSLEVLLVFCTTLNEIHAHLLQQPSVILCVSTRLRHKSSGSVLANWQHQP